jgi:hypothetical protein
MTLAKVSTRTTHNSIQPLNTSADSHRADTATLALPAERTQSISKEPQTDNYSAPGDATAQIRLRTRIASLSETQAFAELCDKSAECKRLLLPADIRSLTPLLAVFSLADNQYSPNAVSPAFHLFEASIITLNGKSVLFVEGRHIGTDTSYYGILVLIGKVSESGVGVQEISLEGPAARSYQYRKAFKGMLASMPRAAG